MAKLNIFDRITGKTSGLGGLGMYGTISEIPTGVIFDNKFGEVFARNIYSKIMHECADRAMLNEEISKAGYTITVHDNYSPYKKGLVSWVVDTMISGQKVYLRKEKVAADVFIFHKLDAIEVKRLEDGVKAGQQFPIEVVELDFTEFTEAAVVRLLFSLLQALLVSMSKGVAISGALVLKIHALSEMIANSSNDAAIAVQVAQINDGLAGGKGAFIDAKSSTDFTTYDSSSARDSINFVFSLISSLTGLPNSYLFGDIVVGIGNGDNGDEERMNAAIRRYYQGVWSGVLYAVYDRVFNYKQKVSDISSLTTMFAFIETTTLLTDEGKLKFMVNNTGLDPEDFTLKGDTQPTPPLPTPQEGNSDTL